MWIDITFAYGSILTSAKMTNLFNNFEGLAKQDSGAPQLWNAYKGMHGFNMDDVSDISSPIYVHALKIQPGRCVDAGGDTVITFDGNLTKEISSGANYSFGNSGGAVPSSFSATWPLISSIDTFKWFHIIFMKNTTSGSMDWGIDTDPYSATNLLTEVNSVNGGGWDLFRRLGSVFAFGTKRIVGFHKRGHLFQRNSGLTLVASVSNNSSYFDFPKIGPTGTDCLINIEFKSGDRAENDWIAVVPYGVNSYGDYYGKYGFANSFRSYGQSITLMVNSGNCQARVSSTTVPDARFILNWWYDPFDQ